MGTAENKQVVLDFYAAGARGDMETCTNIGSTRFSGTFVGKQALVDELLGPLFSQLRSGISSEIQRLTAEGDIVVAQTSGTAETHDGVAYNNTYCQVIRIADGTFAEVTEYMDTALIDDVFGKA